jgi:hypothetical protein
MHEKIARLKTPEECERFAKNVEAKYPVLAKEARRRAIKWRASMYGAKSEAELEALQAVYAYEEVLTEKKGKRTRASGIWQMIKRHGIMEAVQRAVNREIETVRYTALSAMGMQDFAFEAVVVRYPELFKPKTVERAKTRVEEWSRA